MIQVLKKLGKTIGVSTVLIISSQANAAPIDWGSTTDVGTVFDVSNNGGFIEAYNFASTFFGSGVITSVNGVDFVSKTDFLIGDLGSEFDFLPGKTTGNSEYDTILSILDYDVTKGGSVSLDIGGSLVSGLKYELQVWYTDVRESRGSSSRVMTLAGDSGGSVALDNSGSGGSGPGTTGLGQYAIGTFDASGLTQELNISAEGNYEVHFTAYQLRVLTPSVPEPSIFVLFGFSLLALKLAKRRRKV